MTQEEIENKIWRLQMKIRANDLESSMFYDEIKRLNKEAMDLDDKHCLIPNDFKTHNEWLKSHPFPESVKSLIFKNKHLAEAVRLSCNTYQEHYHIVRLQCK